MFAASVGKITVQPIQRIGLQQRGGHGRRLLTSCVSTFAVLGEERAHDGEQAVELLMAFDRSASEWVNLSVNLQGSVQRDELLVVLIAR